MQDAQEPRVTPQNASAKANTLAAKKIDVSVATARCASSTGDPQVGDALEIRKPLYQVIPHS